MEARTKPPEALCESEPKPESERESIRYRLASLLTVEEFETALLEAKAAFEAQKIRIEDYRFVIEITRSAQRMGRAKTRVIDLLDSLAA